MTGIKTKPGFTLVEVLISVTLFVMIMLSATQIFELVISSQRSAIATQNVQESLKYFLEVIAKEMRMAQKNQGVCPGIPDNEIFVVSSNALGDVLNFKNYYGQCITYSLVPDGTNQRFWISRVSGGTTLADFITPVKIRMDSLHFVLNESTSTQPVVMINLHAHALNEAQFQSAMTIQTSITSRYYK